MSPEPLSPSQLKLVQWLRKRKVATRKALQNQFQVSHMTVFRTLKRYGYYTSYNHNAAYYTLCDTPQFDEAGLWAHRDVRFSRLGTLVDTLVALVEQAPAGMTVQELEERLQTKTANRLSRLVHQARLTQAPLAGRQVVYLARDRAQAQRQVQQRRQQPPSVPAAGVGLPVGCSAVEVIEILRELVVTPDAHPRQLVRRLAGRNVTVTAGQVQRVRTHYALEKKRPA